ncbi:hypothetical protein [Zobellia nedashkovskayae]|uniref:hypothetical protein n=1 Tax=Zobellia nedashkovskayae TaxID=2779510 RepID=UPI00188AA10B|nr:hypothetical protein [Zobellia nedashkovskayae]
MKKFTLPIFLISFFVVGELLIRLTEEFKIMETNRIQMVDIALDDTEELKLLEKNKIDLSDSSLRVLVIGDSYMHGAGIPKEKKISSRLRESLLKNNSKYKNIYVLDASVPNSNNLDNKNTYFRYKEEFQPQIVIWGYHYNDINGNLEQTNEPLASNTRKQKSPKQKPAGKESKMKIRKITNLLYNSAMLKFIMPKINSTALSMGYIIPKSRLANTTEHYETNNSTWKKSKQYLAETLKDSKDSDIHFIVYQFAYTNLIEYPELFTDANDEIESFFTSFDNLTYISGTEQFKGQKASDYFIYKDDGHPNAKAHLLISKKIERHIYKYSTSLN